MPGLSGTNEIVSPDEPVLKNSEPRERGANLTKGFNTEVTENTEMEARRSKEFAALPGIFAGRN